LLSAMYIKVDSGGDRRFDRRDDHERERSHDRDARDHHRRSKRSYEESGSGHERSRDRDRQERLDEQRKRRFGGTYGNYGSRGFDISPSDLTSTKSSTLTKPNAVLKGEEDAAKNRSAEGRDMQ